MNITSIQLPEKLLEKWQSLLDDLAKNANIPCAAITKADFPMIENLLVSDSPGNPAEAGHSGRIAGSYCERVINTDKELLIPNALTDPEWDHNPDIKYGLIAYLGFPLRSANGKPFGTICILDSKENRFNEESRDLLIRYQQAIEADLADFEEK